MRLGISTILHESEYKMLMKVSREPARLYLRYVNSTVKFAQEYNLRIIEISGLLANPLEVIPPVMDEIKDVIKGFDEVSFHLPYIPMPLEKIKETIEITQELGVKVLVYHPLFYDSVERKSMEIKRDVILDLISFCNDQGLKLCWENLPLEVASFHRPEEFDFFVENEGFLTLDTGHAVICGVDPIEFIDRFGDKIKHVHLQDGIRGQRDIHYAVGRGELDYVRFLNKLKKIEYKDIIILELVSEQDAIESLNLLKNFIP